MLLLQNIPGLGLFAARSSLGSAGLFSWRDGEWVPKQNILDATKGILGQHRFDSLDPNFRSNSQMVDIPSPEIEQIEMDRKGLRIAWSTRDGALLWSPRDDTSSPHLLWDETKQEGRTIDALRLSDSGRYLGVAFDNKRVLVFDLANHETIETSTYIKIPISDRVRSLDFNNSEELLGTGMENGDLVLWSIPNAIKIAEARGIHSRPTGNVTFSSDGSHLYSHAVVGDGNETAITEVPIPALDPARPLVARASGQPPTRMLVEDKMLVAGDNDGNISLWDLDTRRPIGILRASEHSISAITVDSDQQQVIVADDLEYSGMAILRLRVAGDCLSNGESSIDQRGMESISSWRAILSCLRKISTELRIPYDGVHQVSYLSCLIFILATASTCSATYGSVIGETNEERQYALAA